MIRPIDTRPPRNAADLAERFGTPLYVFDGSRLAAEAEAFRAAWGPDVTIGYSMKSNPLMGIVTRLHRAGMWAEVASGFDDRTARRGGVPGTEIIFNGPHKPIDDLRASAAYRIAVAKALLLRCYLECAEPGARESLVGASASFGG